MIDRATADEQEFKIGETVRVASLGPVRPFKLVGIATVRERQVARVGDLRGVHDPDGAEALRPQGKLDAISVAAKPGISQETLAGEIRDALPATVTVRTATAQAKEDLKQVSFTKIIRYFLLSFGGDRALRGRVRHLQHALDHRRAAHP